MYNTSVSEAVCQATVRYYDTCDMSLAMNASWGSTPRQLRGWPSRGWRPSFSSRPSLECIAAPHANTQPHDSAVLKTVHLTLPHLISSEPGTQPRQTGLLHSISLFALARTNHSALSSDVSKTDKSTAALFGLSMVTLARDHGKNNWPLHMLGRGQHITAILVSSIIVNSPHIFCNTSCAALMYLPLNED